jgi:hypothetical protein
MAHCNFVIYCSHTGWAVGVIGSPAMYCVPASAIHATYRFTALHAARGKNVDSVGRFLKNERLIKIELTFLWAN